MDNMPFYLVLVQSLPETLIIIYIGLVLINEKPIFIKASGIAFVSALLCFFLRSSPLPLAVNVFAQIPFLIALICYLFRLPLSLGFISIILGFITVGMSEVVFNALLSIATGISPGQALEVPLWRILYPLPEFIFLTLLILWLKRKHINITGLINPLFANRGKQQDHFSPILLLSMTVILVVLAFYCQFYMYGIAPLSSRFVACVLLAVLIISVTLSLMLTWKIFYINRQQILVEMQQVNISNLADMLQIIKAQRHDFINHLQVIYGLLKLGEIKQIEDYINTLHHDIQVTGDILRLAIPELSAFLLVQSGQAAQNDISLEIEQETDLSALGIPSPELIAVVGNLLKNAMEAVMDLEPDKRRVKIKIFERSKYYVIQTQNHGWIPRELKNRIFESGFTTKTGMVERGIGLASVKYEVEKHRGMVMVCSHPLNGTRFTVCFPREKGRKIA
jgi:Signal transduction histidine kinase regulating citrate/malate metabolism